MILSVYYKLSFFELVRSSLFVLCFVGFTEYMFLTHIAQNYITVDPNYVKFQILSTMREKIGKQQPVITPQLIQAGTQLVSQYIK